jgi:hypothetical protein
MIGDPDEMHRETECDGDAETAPKCSLTSDDEMIAERAGLILLQTGYEKLILWYDKCLNFAETDSVEK